MKLSRSKMAICGGAMAAMLIMPIAPSLIEAGTTHKQQQSTNLETEQITASYSENIANIVAEAYNQTAEHGMFYTAALAIADTDVYASESTDSEVVGQLYENNIAGVSDVGTEWTKISSGELTGYVRTAGLCFDKEAEVISSDNGGVTANPNNDGAFIYASAYSDAPINTTDSEASFTAIGTCGEYVVIELADGSKGYMNREDVSLDYKFNAGKTTAQIEAEKAAAEAAAKAEAEAAAKAEAEAKAAAEAAEAAEAAKASQSSSGSGSSSSASSYSGSELAKMAAIIQSEAGDQSYEGLLAVGSVIMNRINSSAWPNSLDEVLYQSGQFTPVASGIYQSILASGADSRCTQAAAEVLGGTITNGYFFFHTNRASDAGRSGMVLGDHFFY